MISRIKTFHESAAPSAEILKLKNMAAAYPEETEIFYAADTGAYISLLSGDMIITGSINCEEVKRFLSFVKPRSVFSGADNLNALFGEKNYEEVNVLIKENCLLSGSNTFNCDFSSKEAYGLLKEGGFSLPAYEYFATDYCRRKNRGLIKVFGKKDACIAVTLEGGEYRMLSGIVSKQKGLGGPLLLSAVSGSAPVLAVCRDELLPFYAKYGFKPLYKAGYWRKHN